MKLFTRRRIFTYALAGGIALTGCKSDTKKKEDTTMNETAQQTMAKDVHSYARPEEAVVKHLDLDIKVNFQDQVISGTASYQIENLTGTDTIVFDTRGLQIEKVRLDKDAETGFTLGEEQKFLGQPLKVAITPQTKMVQIEYRTAPDAAALQWLSPQQTAGKVYPFLFTQSQAILARTWIPCQDSPGIRFTYSARVKVPAELMAVMSAENPQQKNQEGVYKFYMRQPIPSYLMALTVGDLSFRPISERTGVYAEPVTLDEAAYEFAELDKMLVAAEKLYGAYRWDRYDLLVLPPSFPFGGMENPRITFVTPTILARDRSLTSLVAHELAHSWSGNLVTNATWNDFWLNEGFTVYFERRIMESIYGKDYGDMLKVLGYQDLQHTLQELKEEGRWEDTSLKLQLEGRDPDDGMNDIAYEKGNLFLLTIEAAVGREKFDRFLNDYFSTFAFRTMETESFIRFLEQKLLQNNPEAAEKINLQAWIYKFGIPEGAPAISSERFRKVEEEVKRWQSGTPAQQLQAKEWSSHEWLHFLRMLPQNLTQQQLAELDKAFGFTTTGNAEILAAWLEIAVKNNYQPAERALEEFLVRVGRRKFLMPLYKALIRTPEGKKRALEIYAKARPNYHSVATSSLDVLLKYKG